MLHLPGMSFLSLRWVAICFGSTSMLTSKNKYILYWHTCLVPHQTFSYHINFPLFKNWSNKLVEVQYVQRFISSCTLAITDLLFSCVAACVLPSQPNLWGGRRLPRSPPGDHGKHLSQRVSITSLDIQHTSNYIEMIDNWSVKLPVSGF